jgi:hypothetical protein
MPWAGNSDAMSHLGIGEHGHGSGDDFSTTAQRIRMSKPGAQMNESLRSLKSNDEVYIRRWNVYGKVLRPHQGTANEPDGERLYEIQITHYFRRADLELYDREAERVKREAARREKMEHMTATTTKLREFLARGGDANSPEAATLAIESFKALDAVRVEFGENPFLIPIKDESAK